MGVGAAAIGPAADMGAAKTVGDTGATGALGAEYALSTMPPEDGVVATDRFPLGVENSGWLNTWGCTAFCVPCDMAWDRLSAPVAIGAPECSPWLKPCARFSGARALPMSGTPPMPAVGSEGRAAWPVSMAAEKVWPGPATVGIPPPGPAGVPGRAPDEGEGAVVA